MVKRNTHVRRFVLFQLVNNCIIVDCFVVKGIEVKFTSVGFIVNVDNTIVVEGILVLKNTIVVKGIVVVSNDIIVE